MRVLRQDALVVPLAERRRGVIELFWLDFLKACHNVLSVAYGLLLKLYLEGAGRLEDRHALARLLLRCRAPNVHLTKLKNSLIFFFCLYLLLY